MMPAEPPGGISVDVGAALSGWEDGSGWSGVASKDDSTGTEVCDETSNIDDIDVTEGTDDTEVVDKAEVTAASIVLEFVAEVVALAEAGVGGNDGAA
jgi:hypothetical protein